MSEPQMNGTLARNLATALFHQLNEQQRKHLASSSDMHELRTRIRELARNNPHVRGYDELLDMLERADGHLRDGMLEGQRVINILGEWMAGDTDEVLRLAGISRNAGRGVPKRKAQSPTTPTDTTTQEVRALKLRR